MVIARAVLARATSSLRVATRLAGFDLDDQQPELWMNDNLVRLAVMRGPGAPRLGAPPDVLVEPILGGKRRPQDVEDMPLSGLTASLRYLVQQSAVSPAPSRIRSLWQGSRAAGPNCIQADGQVTRAATTKA